jgi:hypothetical protein
MVYAESEISICQLQAKMDVTVLWEQTGINEFEAGNF